MFSHAATPSRSRTPSLFALALVGTLGLAAAGCDGGEDASAPAQARNAELSQLQGSLVEVIPSKTLTPEELRAVASHLEQSASAERAKVMVRQEDDGSQHLEVELWAARSLDASTYEDLRTKFPALADATITHAAVDGPPADDPELPALDIDENLSAEEIKAKVEADLAAKGMPGEVVVDVTEKDGERHVEVHIEHEKHEKAE